MKKTFSVNTEETKMRKAFSMIEVMLVIAVVAIAIVGYFVVYPKIKTQTTVDTEYKRIQSVISTLENHKSGYNNGAYAATGTKNINVIPVFSQLMGGANGVADVATWRYGCAAGGASIARVTTTNYESADVRNLLLLKVNNNMAPWVATASGTLALAISKANSVCK